jgi:glucokinase
MVEVLGIDIGGTKCTIILGSIDKVKSAFIIDKEVFKTDVKKGPQNTINHIINKIGIILKRNSCCSSSLSGIGISCGGTLDSDKGVVLSPPNLPWWDNIPIVNIIEQEFGVKTFLQNDANASALAEWKFCAGRGFMNLAILTFGTGMGSGLILDGKLYNGASGMAGEIGHIRMEGNGPVGYGKSGSFEGFCSKNGIAQLARTKFLENFQMGKKVSFCKGPEDLDRINAKIVAYAVQEGDATAIEVYRICGHYLGRVWQS